MRQDQPQFIQMLQEVRLGIVTTETKCLLQSRIVKNIDQATSNVELEDGSIITIKPTILYPFRKDVDMINKEELTALKQAGKPSNVYRSVDKKYDYKTRSTGPASKDDTSSIEERSPQSIELAVDALVMLTTNIDTEAGLVNGSRGKIVLFKDGYPMVQFTNGAYEHIKPVQFESVVNTGIVRRTQIPLTLAWAMTIHKCQGSTLDGVVTDLRGAFCDAQSYVTLSRVRSLETLFLLGIDLTKIRCNSKVKEYYDGLERGEGYSKTEIFAEEEEPDMGKCIL
jgi:ATP-dependent DNA helicase PIF1